MKIRKQVVNSRACRLFSVSAASMSSCDMPDKTLAARFLLSSSQSSSIASFCDMNAVVENGGGAFWYDVGCRDSIELGRMVFVGVEMIVPTGLITL